MAAPGHGELKRKYASDDEDAEAHSRQVKPSDEAETTSSDEDDSPGDEDDSEDKSDNKDTMCAVCQNLGGSEDYLEVKVDLLEQSAEDDCPGCSVLLNIYNHYNPDEGDIPNFICIRSHIHEDQRFAVDLEIDEWNVVIGLSVAPGMLNVYHLPVSGHSNNPLDSASGDSKGPAPSQRTLSIDSSLAFAACFIDTSMPVINKWLSDCQRFHFSCLSSNQPLLPARVLYIGGPDRSRIYLKEIGKHRADYICLSYCWGDAEFFKLRKSNLAACKNGITSNKLPATFQYAIEIARRLEINYVWIDALCIIQDDPMDWDIQASTMADVYHRSFLVLAMTKNSNPDRDCRAEELPPVVVIDLIETRLLSHTTHTHKPVASLFPLVCRAWAFKKESSLPECYTLSNTSLPGSAFPQRIVNVGGKGGKR